MPFIKHISRAIKPLLKQKKNLPIRNGAKTSGRAGGWVGSAKNMQDPRRRPQEKRSSSPEFWEPPQEVDTGRLEPVASFFGGTLLVSPDEAVHPFDCGLWPSSPFCNPEDAVNFDSFIDITPEVTVNSYETVLVIQPTLAWLSLPPMIVAYRYGDPPPKASRTPPRQTDQTYYPVTGGDNSGCIYSVSVTFEATQATGGQYVREVVTHRIFVFGPVGEIAIQEAQIGGPNPAYTNAAVLISAHGEAQGREEYWTGPLPNPTGWVRGEGASVVQLAQGPIVFMSAIAELITTEWAGDGARFVMDQIIWNADNCPYSNDLLPPPLNQPQNEDDMGCNCKQIEADLRAIKKFLGVKQEPWVFPSSLGSEEGGTQSIPDIANMMAYFAKQMSGMLGATGEIKIKVKDSSITQEGDQEVELSFPNIAEAIANLTGLAITNQAISSATLDASLRGLFQAGQAFTSAAVGTEQIESIMEWLGFEMKKKSLQVPLAYTPGKESPDKILKDSQVYLSYWDVDDKKSLQDYLNIFIVASEIVKAANFQKLEDPFDYRVRVNHAAANLGERDVDLDSYLDRVEDGFINNASGNTDTTPYGRPYNERPRIRNINKEAGDGNNP